MESVQFRFTPQPAGWSFQAYNVLTLVLSAIFILCLVVLYTLSRTVSVLPHAYRMVTFERRRLFCFGVDITSGRQAHKVRMLYVWMFRAALLVMFCYVWQSCVLNYKAIDFSSHRGPHELQRQCVYKEADCFGAPQHYRFYDFYATPASVCSLFPEIQQGNIQDVQEEILNKYPYILCLSFVQPDAFVYTGSVAVAYSLGFLILTAFEVLVWLLYRARKRWLPVAVFLLGVGVLGVWVGSLFIPSFFTFFGNWIGFVMVLTVPWNLWLSLAAAYNLRKLQHQKWALWQEESNRPLASSALRRLRRVSADSTDSRPENAIATGGAAFKGVSPRLSCDGSALDIDVGEVLALKASNIRREELRQEQHTRGGFEFSALKEKLADVKKGLLHRRDPGTAAQEHQQLLENRTAPLQSQAAGAEEEVGASRNSNAATSSSESGAHSAVPASAAQNKED